MKLSLLLFLTFASVSVFASLKETETRCGINSIQFVSEVKGEYDHKVAVEFISSVSKSSNVSCIESGEDIVAEFLKDNPDVLSFLEGDKILQDTKLSFSISSQDTLEIILPYSVQELDNILRQQNGKAPFENRGMNYFFYESRRSSRKAIIKGYLYLYANPGSRG